MSNRFPDVKFTLTADPNTIYLDLSHSFQGLTIKFTLTVENGSASDFNVQARSVRLFQNGGFSHSATVVEDIKIVPTGKVDLLVCLYVDDVHRLSRGTAEAEAELTSTGVKAKISLTVEPSNITSKH
jgi:hypothetical protein